MNDALRAEFLIMRKRPSTWILLGLVIGDVLFWNYFLGYGTWLQIKAHVLSVPPFMTSPVAQPFAATQVIRATVDQVGYLDIIALILGALAAGSAYSWGTLKTELTAGTPRPTIVAAQFLVLALLSLPLVPILFAIAAGLTFVLSASESHFPMIWPPLWQFPAAMGAIYLNLVLYMAFGLLLAIAVRSSGVGIGLGLGYLYGFDALAQFPLVQRLEQWLPWGNAFSLFPVFGPSGSGPLAVECCSPPNALLPILNIVGFTIAFLVIAGFVLSRRDVI